MPLVYPCLIRQLSPYFPFSYGIILWVPLCTIIPRHIHLNRKMQKWLLTWQSCPRWEAPWRRGRVCRRTDECTRRCWEGCSCRPDPAGSRTPGTQGSATRQSTPAHRTPVTDICSGTFSSIDDIYDIDKVYIDGPCEKLIRRSIYKLLPNNFCKIPEPDHTENALVLLVPFIKVSHVTHSFEMRKENPGCCFSAT